MITVSKLEVRSFDLDHLDVFWEIPQIPAVEGMEHEIYDYEFSVLRSEGPMGPFEKVGGPFRDTYVFRDSNVSLLNKFVRYFYKIEVHQLSTGETVEFGPAAANTAGPDLIAAEIIRQEEILFREFIGRRCILFPVRTFGPRCSCYSIVHGRKTRGNHGPCFGTGWLGGFLSPIEVFVQIDPTQKVKVPMSTGESGPADTQARMISFPPVNVGDILVESENRRWRVTNVSQTERLRATVRQEIGLHEIARGDIEYALPINVDLKTFSPAEERNFTNPQTLNEDDLKDLIAIFGRPRGSL